MKYTTPAGVIESVAIGTLKQEHVGAAVIKPQVRNYRA